MPLRGLEHADLTAGTVLLDRYTIIDRIAGGGMATIHRATDERLDRVVCVKLLRLIVEGSGSSAAEGGSVYQATYSYFHTEALALSKLQHPNTLRIYDFGYLADDDDRHGQEGPRSFALGTGHTESENGRPFQISEFLDGGNLEQFVRTRGRLRRKEALAILERMAGAVAEAHSHGIIHRDIKPSNILFARVGEILMPKLADFGIARCDLRRRAAPGEPEGKHETVRTIPLFSPRWAAPEQLFSGQEGPATDVYALGLVTTFMLVGRPLFDQDDVRSTFTERVRSDDYVTGRLTQCTLPAAARAVLLDALRADPQQRTRDPLAFFNALNAAMGVPSASLPPPVLAPSAPTSSSEDLTAVSAPSAQNLAVARSGSSPRAELGSSGGWTPATAQAVESAAPAATDSAAGHPQRGAADARPPLQSITLELAKDGAPRAKAPPERQLVVGGRVVRVLEVHEKVDLVVPVAAGEVRFRVTLLPARTGSIRMHLKGLSCFVRRSNGPASPALVADAAGDARFVSTSRVDLGGVAWSFGIPTATGRVFSVGVAGELSVDTVHALALDLGEPRELIVICRRA